MTTPEEPPVTPEPDPDPPVYEAPITPPPDPEPGNSPQPGEQGGDGG